MNFNPTGLSFSKKTKFRFTDLMEKSIFVGVSINRSGIVISVGDI